MQIRIESRFSNTHAITDTYCTLYNHQSCYLYSTSLPNFYWSISCCSSSRFGCSLTTGTGTSASGGMSVRCELDWQRLDHSHCFLLEQELRRRKNALQKSIKALLAGACLLWSMDVAETSQKSLQVNQFAIRIWRGSSSKHRCTPLRKEALDDHKLCFCPTWAALRSAHHCTPFSRRIERVLESVQKYRARTESIISFAVQSMPLTHRRSVQPVLDAASHRVESTACAHGACSSLVFFQTQVEIF